MAVGDELGIIATPSGTANVSSDREAVAAVSAACAEKEIETIVVGLPLNMNGTKGPMAIKAEAFAEALREATGLPVVMWDERLSSRAAERAMLEADLSRRKRKGLVDKLAAQIILQSYLDAQAY